MFLESIYLLTNGDALVNSGTSETTLGQFSIPGGEMPGKIRGVEILVFGATAANGNVKTLKLYFGSTVIANPIGSGVNNKDWYCAATVIWQSANVQKATAFYEVAGTTSTFINTALTQTDANAILIKVTGQSDTAGSDITENGLYIRRLF